MTTTSTPTETITEVECGNVLRITGTDITGSVVQTYPDRFEMIWSDGTESVERYPIVGIEFF